MRCRHAFEDITPEELFDLACSKYLDYTKAQYFGWDAKIVFENRHGKLIDGYCVEYPQQKFRAKLSAWTHRTDPTGLQILSAKAFKQAF